MLPATRSLEILRAWLCPPASDRPGTPIQGPCMEPTSDASPRRHGHGAIEPTCHGQAEHPEAPCSPARCLDLEWYDYFEGVMGAKHQRGNYW